jgi:hypothetical protein
MKRYHVVKTFVLSFLEGREQVQYIFASGHHGVIECDGTTIYYTTAEGKRYESITNANAIAVALAHGDIEERL